MITDCYPPTAGQPFWNQAGRNTSAGRDYTTVFLSILNQMDFHLVQNRKENCHHDQIPFNAKGNGNIVFSVWRLMIRESSLVYPRERNHLTDRESDELLVPWCNDLMTVIND